MILVEKAASHLVWIGFAYVVAKAVKKLFPEPEFSEVHPAEHTEPWDRVDEASWESFPASDAPGNY